MPSSVPSNAGAGSGFFRGRPGPRLTGASSAGAAAAAGAAAFAAFAAFALAALAALPWPRGAALTMPSSAWARPNMIG